MFKHILVPTDGSQLSQDTARRAVSFAKEAGARVTVFFAKPEYPIAYFGEGALIEPTTPEKFAELADQQAALYLGEIQGMCAEAGVECATTSATSDVPYEAIIEAATKSGFRLCSPIQCMSIATERIIDVGFALSKPCSVGADPCCAWAQQCVSLAIIDPANPRLPDISLAKSLRMSP